MYDINKLLRPLGPVWKDTASAVTVAYTLQYAAPSKDEDDGDDLRRIIGDLTASFRRALPGLETDIRVADLVSGHERELKIAFRTPIDAVTAETIVTDVMEKNLTRIHATSYSTQVIKPEVHRL